MAKSLSVSESSDLAFAESASFNPSVDSIREGDIEGGVPPEKLVVERGDSPDVWTYIQRMEKTPDEKNDGDDEEVEDEDTAPDTYAALSASISEETPSLARTGSETESSSPEKFAAAEEPTVSNDLANPQLLGTPPHIASVEAAVFTPDLTSPPPTTTPQEDEKESKSKENVPVALKIVSVDAAAKEDLEGPQYNQPNRRKTKQSSKGGNTPEASFAEHYERKPKPRPPPVESREEIRTPQKIGPQAVYVAQGSATPTATYRSGWSTRYEGAPASEGSQKSKSPSSADLAHLEYLARTKSESPDKESPKNNINNNNNHGNIRSGFWSATNERRRHNLVHYTNSIEEKLLPCLTCGKGKRETMLLPCSHLCVCKKCSVKITITKCPLCEEVVTDRKVIFL
uniref:RING-type domain-containing protein n=1 Tax=Cyclophora tenuis TaxID=216820 RepID=A0A7S1GH69_CYCTE